MARRPLARSTRRHSRNTLTDSPRKKKTIDIATALNALSVNGKILSCREHHLRAGRASTCELDHLLAVVEPRCAGAGRLRLAEQEPAAAADLEEVIARLERENLEDRPPREVVDVLGAVDLPRA